MEVFLFSDKKKGNLRSPNAIPGHGEHPARRVTKLPKCRYLSCSHPTGALAVTKVWLFIVSPTQLVPSELPKCRYLSFSPSEWRPRNYQSVAIYNVLASKLPKSSYFRVPRFCALEVTKESPFVVFLIRLASSELPKLLFIVLPPVLRRHSVVIANGALGGVAVPQSPACRQSQRFRPLNRVLSRRSLEPMNLRWQQAAPQSM